MKSLEDFMKKLRERADIQIDQDRLARLAVTGRPEEPDGSHAGGSNPMEGHGE